MHIADYFFADYFFALSNLNLYQAAEYFRAFSGDSMAISLGGGGGGGGGGGRHKR